MGNLGSFGVGFFTFMLLTERVLVAAREHRHAAW